MLRLTSYARPSKLLTANKKLFLSIVGTLKPEKLTQIRDAVIAILNSSFDIQPPLFGEMHGNKLRCAPKWDN